MQKSMKKVARAMTTVIATAILSACGGGDEGALCSSITGGGATVTSDCTGCTVQNAGDAADGDLDTFGSLEPALVGSPMGFIRATAQEGIVYPAGSVAGAFLDGDIGTAIIRTYLNGVMQESKPAGFDNYDTHGGTGARIWSGIRTTLPFNAVEVRKSGGSSTQIFELCSDGGVS